MIRIIFKMTKVLLLLVLTLNMFTSHAQNDINVFDIRKLHGNPPAVIAKDSLISLIGNPIQKPKRLWAHFIKCTHSWSECDTIIYFDTYSYKDITYNLINDTLFVSQISFDSIYNNELHFESFNFNKNTSLRDVLCGFNSAELTNISESMWTPFQYGSPYTFYRCTIEMSGKYLSSYIALYFHYYTQKLVSAEFGYNEW